jgi:CRP/FNR family cyclic AMP-dependent transcriptional regulator
MDAQGVPHQNEEARAFSKGQTIFLKGDLGNHMYVVLKGQVEIRIDDRVVDTVNPGQIFGEMGLIDGSPRAAAAVANSEGLMLEIDEKQFHRLVKESPDFALRVLRTVVERVRRANRLTVSTADSTP